MREKKRNVPMRHVLIIRISEELYQDLAARVRRISAEEGRKVAISAYIRSLLRSDDQPARKRETLIELRRIHSDLNACRMLLERNTNERYNERILSRLDEVEKGFLHIEESEVGEHGGDGA